MDTTASNAPASSAKTYHRLQTQIGLAVGLLMLVLAGTVAVALSGTAERQVLAISAQNVENLAQQLAHELSDGMDNFARDVADQSLRVRFSDPAIGVERVREALDQFKQHHPEFAYVSVVDVATSRVIAANGGIFEGGDATGRPTFEEGKKGIFLGDVHDAVRLAELLPKPANGEPLRFLDVAAPIRDASGKVSRVFAAHVGWQWTASVIDRVLGPLKTQRDVDALLLDTQGKVVMSGSPDIAVGTVVGGLVSGVGPAAQTLAWPDGQQYLTYAVKVKPQGSFNGFGWKVVVRKSYGSAAAPARSLLWAFLAAALALGAVAATVGWFVAGRLTRPVRLLADAAKQAASDSGLEPLDIDSRSNEVAEVHQALAKIRDNAREHAIAAEAADRQFAVLAASLPQLVWQANADGRLQFINRPETMVGHAHDARYVADLVHAIHPEDKTVFLNSWDQCLVHGTDQQLRCRLLVPGGAEARWCDVWARAVRDSQGRVLRWVGTVFDVHEMVSQAASAEQRLGEERIARAEAERMARLRDEFMATVSHELRSPLSAITGWSEILLRKSSGDDTLTRAGEVIRRNAMLQARLIDDLLDMTAVMAGKLTLAESRFDIVRLVQAVTQSHLPAAGQKGIYLKCQDAAPAMVYGDPKRLSQVLDNLIGNALKFTDNGGVVRITPTVGMQFVQIEVKDNGKGIVDWFLPYVFDRMRQQDGSKTRQAGGLGIGLAIAKAVVELHHGSIRAESGGPNRGSTFVFSIPLAEPEARATPDSEDDSLDAVELGGIRILLVDDEQDAREVAQVALASMGAAVRLASSGAEALQLLAGEDFDVLISDIGMPFMDGLSLVREVRERPGRNRHIPAAALSAFTLESENREGLAAGFDTYIAKPISLWRLGQGVRLAQARARQRQAQGAA